MFDLQNNVLIVFESIKLYYLDALVLDSNWNGPHLPAALLNLDCFVIILHIPVSSEKSHPACSVVSAQAPDAAHNTAFCLKSAV